MSTTARTPLLVATALAILALLVTLRRRGDTSLNPQPEPPGIAAA